MTTADITPFEATTPSSAGSTASVSIAGLPEWIAAQEYSAQLALRALADLLNNVPARAPERDAFEQFCERSLGLPIAELVSETHNLSGVGRITGGLAIAELLNAHQPQTGPHSYRPEPPRWGTFEAGGETLHFPTDVAFYTDTVVPGLDAIVALRSTPALSRGEASSISVHVRPDDQQQGRKLLQQILSRAGELNIFRGRVLQASLGNHGLAFEIIDAPHATRSKIIATEDVWDEIDLNVRGVSSQHSTMTELGLGGRRGVLLAGPPGVGKSAIASVIAAEMAGQFTVVYCDAACGASLLSNVFTECIQLGPALVIIEDVDLIVGRRGGIGSRPMALSEFLAALDSHPDAPLLVMATTNDVTTLDSAAVRAARFDSIIEVPYPSATVARQIFRSLLHSVPGSADIDIDAVAASLPPQTSGADIREIVRRAVLHPYPLSTAALQTQISSGRYRPTMPAGTYL